METWKVLLLLSPLAIARRGCGGGGGGGDSVQRRADARKETREKANASEILILVIRVEKTYSNPKYACQQVGLFFGSKATSSNC